MASLNGKTAFITGGSSGIGAATARRFAGEGARVIIGYHEGRERAENLREGLDGKEHMICQLALESSASVAAAAQTVGARFDCIDILVNSAGFTRAIPHSDLTQLDEELFDQLLLANARGPYSIIRHFLPILQKSGAATVINISSISAFTGAGSNIAYCAAKAALDTMTMSLARAFGPEVRFLCVSPAQVTTDFVPGRDKAAVQKAAQGLPIRRPVEAEDVADAVLACVTLLKTATGSRIVIDGGHHLK